MQLVKISKNLLIFSILGWASISSGVASDFYNFELNAVRERERIYVSEMQRFISAMKLFERNWKEIGNEGRAFSAVAGTEVSQSSLSTPESLPNLRYLELLSKKKAKIEIALRHLRGSRERVDLLLKNAEEALQMASFESDSVQRQSHQVSKAALLKKFDQREEKLLSAQNEVSTRLEDLKRLIVAAEVRNDIAVRNKIATDLAFGELTSQIKQIFKGMERMFLMEAEVKKDRARATEFYTAYEWFYESAFPELYSRVDSPEKQRLYDELFALISDKMSDLEKKYRVVQGVSIRDLAPVGRFVLSYALDRDQDSSEDERGQRPYPVQPNAGDSKSCRPDGLNLGGKDYAGQEASSDKDAKRFNELTSVSNPNERAAVERSQDRKIMSYEQMKNSIEFRQMLAREESKKSWNGFSRQMERAPPKVRQSPEAKGVNPPSSRDSSKPSQKQNADVRDMIDRSRIRTEHPGQRAELEQLAQEYNQFLQYQDALDSEAEPSREASSEAAVQALGGWRDGTDPTLPELPSELSELAPTPSELENEIAESAKTLADFALGFVGGTAYDALNFVSAVTLNKDLTGRTTDQIDKALIGASVAIGMVAPVGAKSKALQALRKAVEEGGLSSAAKSGLGKMAQLGPDGLRELLEKFPKAANSVGEAFEKFWESWTKDSTSGVKLFGKDFAKHHPGAIEQFAKRAGPIVDSLQKRVPVKVYVGMREPHASKALAEGLGNPEAVKYIKGLPEVRAGIPARSAALDLDTLEKEVFRNGFDPNVKFLSADYLPKNLEDFVMMPSVRNLEGGINIHHTDIDSINDAFKGVKLITK